MTPIPHVISDPDDPASEILASQLDLLLEGMEARLARLYNERSWFAFGLGSVPSHQIPPLGAIYVLTSDAARSILPPPGTAGAGYFWPNQYVHADHLAAAAALTVVGLDPLSVAWEVTGTYSVGGYVFGDCPQVLERTHTEAGVTRTLPMRLSGRHEPERFFRYALADVFLEDDAATSGSWTYDKFGVVRFHNLGRQEVSISLGDGFTIVVGARRCRTIRRLSRQGEWILTPTRKYFPVAQPRDVPSWDARTNLQPTWPGKSQAANPVFRVGLLQSMARPTEITTGPGLFSSAVIGAAASGTTVLGNVVAQPGTVEIIRGTTATDTVERFTWSFDGTMSPTPTALADAGLRVVLSNPERSAVIEPDPTFPAPGSGSWIYDLISRGSNVTGHIILKVPGAVRPWFATAAAADDWYASLFSWPSGTSYTEMVEQEWETSSTFTPTGGGLDTDYYGSWSAFTATNERRSYRALWAGPSSPVIPTWNFWTTTVADALPTGWAAVAVGNTLCVGVNGTEVTDFWHADSDPTFDDACPVDPVFYLFAIGIQILVGGRPIGLGQPSLGGWSEPRWQVAVFPTIGADPISGWDSLAYRASNPSEEIVWTPLHREEVGAGTVAHFRTRGDQGRSGGGDWSWSYGTKSNRAPDVPGAPSSLVMSGMSFWRVFNLACKQPGETDAAPGQPRCGIHPWPVRDHGWLADEILDGTINAAGDPWRVARAQLYDQIRIGGDEELGVIRLVEYHVGMQVRMCAPTYNQIADLINGLTHVRPCGWDNFVDGFPWLSLVVTSGWDTGTALLHGPSGIHLQPFGSVHIYGQNATIDAKLDGLGVTRRSATCPELQAMATVACKEYRDTGIPATLGQMGYVTAADFTRPSDWSSLGGTLQYCTADDIQAALSGTGWTFNHASFVQPVSLQQVIPGPDIETVRDTMDGRHPVVLHTRARFTRTGLAVVPDTGTTPAYQIRSNDPFRVQLGAPRPWRSQVLFRVENIGVLTYLTHVIQVGQNSGPVWDSLQRFADEDSNRRRWWNYTLLAPSTIGGQWDVLVLPLRKLLWDWTPDHTGPRVRLDWGENPGTTITLPDSIERPRWYQYPAGGTVSYADLGGATPTWPNKHHTWELLIHQRTIETL